MSNLEIKSVGVTSLIYVTFPEGLENPRFVIENIRFDNDKGKQSQDLNSQSATLKACAKLFLDQAEVIEAEFKKSINNQVMK